MSLFRYGFTVQKKKVTERPNNSDASEDLEIVEIQPAVPAYFPKHFLGQCRISCSGIVRCELGVPHSAEGSSATSAARKRGKYQHYSAETCAKILEICQ